MKYTIEARWAEVAKDTMYAYGMASAYAHDPREVELAAHVEIISAHLGRRHGATGKRRKEK